MAGTVKSEAEVDVAMPRKSSKMLVVMMINMLLLAGVLGYLFLFDKPAAKTGASPQAGNKGPLLMMDDFIVNLSDPETNRYLKIGLAFELTGEAAKEKVRDREPIIRDAIISLTSSRAYKQIRTLNGKQSLRDEIKTRMSETLGEGVVLGVYFTEFVVQ